MIILLLTVIAQAVFIKILVQCRRERSARRIEMAEVKVREEKKNASKSATKDMTVGSPMRLILGFSIPLLCGALFQQFYSVVDTVIVGRILGVNALAGVGATGSVNFMIVGFCMGVCSGFSIPIAHKFGAGDYSGMRQFAANSTWLAAIFSAVITVTVVFLCKNILMWMKTPEDIFAESYAYIVVIFAGIPATFLYNMLSGIIRAMGNSRTPLYFLMLSSVLNIGLDFLCILTFDMGVAGAAVATVVSQLVSGVLCLIYTIKKFELLHITKEEWKINAHHMWTLCGMGIPMGLQYSITAIGSVILQTAVNTLGSAVVAAVTAAGKVSMFVSCPFDAMGSTMATYAGQNVGAGKQTDLRGCRYGSHCQRAKRIYRCLKNHSANGRNGILQSHGNSHIAKYCCIFSIHFPFL